MKDETKVLLGVGAVAAAWLGARYVFGELGRKIGASLTFEPVGTPPATPPAAGQAPSASTAGFYPRGEAESRVGTSPGNPYPSFRMPPRPPAR